MADANLSAATRQARQERERRAAAELAAKLVGECGWSAVGECNSAVYGQEHGSISSAAALNDLLSLCPTCSPAPAFLQRRSGRMRRRSRLPGGQKRRRRRPSPSAAGLCAMWQVWQQIALAWVSVPV